MVFRYLGPDRLEDQLAHVIERLAEGAAPRDIELRNIDIKEEPGRRDREGNLLPGQAKNEQAAAYLAGELACMANTPDGGIIILGISDSGERIGTDLDAEWLRHRIYELTDRRLTIEVREGLLDGTRILVLRAPEAVEAVPYKGRIRWRVADNCVEVDAATWSAGKLIRIGVDWSAQSSGHKPEDASSVAIEVARRYLRQAANDPAAQDLAEASDADLLRRLNVVNPDGYLNNAGSLLFVSTPVSGIDYIRRDYPGSDSSQRIRAAGPLLAQLAEVEAAANAANRMIHIPAGLVRGQVRALPSLAIREVIVNGVVHRDWMREEPTVVEHVGDTIVTTSPGGFIFGVSPANIITHPSTPRYRRLSTVVSQLRLSEQEGIGVDRVFAAMLSLGHGAPDIREIEGPRVRVALIGGDPDQEWLDFLAGCEPETVQKDVDMLLLMNEVVNRGWIDAKVAAPVLQRSLAETEAAIARLERVRFGGEKVVVQVAGIPSTTEPAWRLSNTARERLPVRTKNRIDAAVRQELIEDWARQRGRVSSTEAADLLGITQGYAGSILTEMEQAGQLLPVREKRRGRGFFYLPAPKQRG